MLWDIVNSFLGSLPPQYDFLKIFGVLFLLYIFVMIFNLLYRLFFEFLKGLK